MRLNTDTDYAIAANEFRRLLCGALGEVDNALSARVQLAGQVEQLQLSLTAALQIERLRRRPVCVRSRTEFTPAQA